MIEAAMIWNEPNNKSHWDPELDPGLEPASPRWRSPPGRRSGPRIPTLPRVLGGMSPIDPAFVRNMAGKGVLDHVDVVAVHGFPLDWNLWQIHEWPAKIDEIRAVTDLPIWVSEVGVSTFGAEEVQVWGLERTAELLDRQGAAHPLVQPLRPAARLGGDDPPPEAEGSSYYRHFYMGLLREDGTPKPAARGVRAAARRSWASASGSISRTTGSTTRSRWMKRLGVRYLRTGLSWADSFRPNALDWFDRQMEALADFDVTVTFCFTPEHRGIAPHHTSPPLVKEEFAEFCAAMIRRYAPSAGASKLELLQAAV